MFHYVSLTDCRFYEAGPLSKRSFIFSQAKFRSYTSISFPISICITFIWKFSKPPIYIWPKKFNSSTFALIMRFGLEPFWAHRYAFIAGINIFFWNLPTRLLSYFCLVLIHLLLIRETFASVFLVLTQTLIFFECKFFTPLLRCLFFDSCFFLQ